MPEIVDPTNPVAPALLTPPLTAELEILAARRAFPQAQQLLSGSPIAAPRRLTVGWHDSAANPEVGSFAVLAAESGLDDLIGEILLVSYKSRSVFVYVLQLADVPTQVSLCRRPFAAIAALTREQITASVAVTG